MRPIRHFGHEARPPCVLRQTPEAYWFMKQIDYKVARLGVMTQQSPDKCIKLAGTKICLLSNLIGLTRLRGGALSPIRLFKMGAYPNGRGTGLKIRSVRVRIPLPLPFILRASVAVARRSLKPLWLGSNPRPSAIKDAYSNFFKEQIVNLLHLKCASSLLYACVAQLVERRIEAPGVGSSSLSPGTNLEAVQFRP